MLGKILTKLIRFDRKRSYFVASFLAMIIVILTDIHPLQSTVVPESARSIFEPTEHLVDLEKFSGMVANLEENGKVTTNATSIVIFLTVLDR